jgi:hypothetical protein
MTECYSTEFDYLMEAIHDTCMEIKYGCIMEGASTDVATVKKEAWYKRLINLVVRAIDTLIKFMKKKIRDFKIFITKFLDKTSYAKRDVTVPNYIVYGVDPQFIWMIRSAINDKDFTYDKGKALLDEYKASISAKIHIKKDQYINLSVMEKNISRIEKYISKLSELSDKLKAKQEKEDYEGLEKLGDAIKFVGLCKDEFDKIVNDIRKFVETEIRIIVPTIPIVENDKNE